MNWISYTMNLLTFTTLYSAGFIGTVLKLDFLQEHQGHVHFVLA